MSALTVLLLAWLAYVLAPDDKEREKLFTTLYDEDDDYEN